MSDSKLNQPETQLNAVEVLGQILKEIGIDRVKLIGTHFVSNEIDEVVIMLSLKHFDRLQSILKDKMVVK